MAQTSTCARSSRLPTATCICDTARPRSVSRTVSIHNVSASADRTLEVSKEASPLSLMILCWIHWPGASGIGMNVSGARGTPRSASDS